MELTKYFKKRTIIFLLSGVPTFVLGQIETDGTLGVAATILNETDYIIGPELGKTEGSNLFYSFKEFNINTNQSATFTGPSSIENIISRVTGGNVSNIDGVLRSSIAEADFYFINPAGIVFGPNAQLDLSGSFYISTGDFIEFVDGQVFYSEPLESEFLSTAPPIAFGFLDNPTGLITVDGSQLTLTQTDTILSDVPQPSTALDEESEDIVFAAPMITFTNGARLLLEGGNTINSDINRVVIQPEVVLVAPTSAGRIFFSDRVGAGQLPPMLPDFEPGKVIFFRENSNIFTVDFSSFGFIRLDQGSKINIDSVRGGRISVQADSLVLTEDAEITSGAFVNLLQEVDEFEEFEETQEAVVVTFGLGSPMNVPRLFEDILVDVNDLEISKAGKVVLYLSRISFLPLEDATLRINANNISIDGDNNNPFTGIFAQSQGGEKRGDWITSITAIEQLNIFNGGRISTTQGSLGGAELSILASLITIDGDSNTRASSEGDSIFLPTGIFSQNHNANSIGGAGSITMSGIQTLQLLNGGRISTTINDNDLSISPTLVGGNIFIQAENIVIDRNDSSQGTGIFSQNHDNSTGSAPGSIFLEDIGSLSLFNGGRISVSTFFGGTGATLTVNANEIYIDQQDTGFATGLFAQNNSLNSLSSDAGDIIIEGVQLLHVTNGGRLSVSTSGGGNAGNITIKEKITDAETIGVGTLLIDGQLSNKSTGIFSQSNASASGISGDITIQQTDTIRIINGGTLSTRDFGSNTSGIPDGEITIESNQVFLETNGSISASTFDVSNGGSVLVKANTITIDGNNEHFNTGIFSETVAVSGNAGNAGDLRIGAEQISLLNGGRISTSTTGTGRAGDIIIGQAENLSFNENGLVIVDNGAPSTLPGVNQIILEGGRIDSASTLDTPLAGLAGAIKISVTDKVELLNDSTLSVSAVNSSESLETNTLADSSILIQAPNLVYLLDSQITTSVLNGFSEGGNIGIDPEFVILNNSQILANADQGNGGNITIVADFFIASQDSLINASSQFGVNGTISILSPDVDIASGLIQLPKSFLNADSWTVEKCAVRSGSQSSFIATELNGTRATPGDLLPSFLLTL